MKKRISMFWAQGEAGAPEIVRRCWDAWARLNPGWSLEIRSDADAGAAFDALGLAHAPETFQGRADVIRVQDIAAHGGVYVDCGTIPCRPLDDWLEPLMEEGFFAFHDPYRRRPIENWFLAATPGHPLAEGWLAEMRRYWDRPRRPQAQRRELDRGGKGALACSLAGLRAAPRSKRVLEPKDRVWSVHPEGGAQRPVHPYFWPHYLFALRLQQAPDFREAWARVPKRPSYENLMVRHWKRDYATMSDTELRSLLGAPMQKLSLKSVPKPPHLDMIFEAAEQG
ncbi:glycosyltransferase family 32 protein [Alloyangia pacifica]|uniref:Capsular polysaccharide synthesis protein n=1 Tax=Alloyangia pacifica TaxID=311180 RepID=A0A1I6RLP5_9RHOB|nr:capsular polysaccharide synthesis protein [Alloyangia pacifica]SDI69027.1 Capsular polysaccharide synthesis protein [Alloyangia pacifica]SFS65625.1 Capsular polysaccharide synthesis protein [Alloyangia pacifica]